MEEKGDACGAIGGNHEGEDHLKDLGTDGRKH